MEAVTEADLKKLENLRKEYRELGEAVKMLPGISIVPRKNKRGRPTKLTPAVVTKIVAAFNMGYNDKEASLYASISRKTFYEWLQEYPDFRYKINQAKVQPNVKAKEVVINAVNAGDVSASKWWLERKAADEFSTKPSEGSNIPPELEEHLNTLKDVIAVQEKRISYHYRTAIYRLREQERASTNKSKHSGKTTIKDDFYTRLLTLPDNKLADHISQEVSATGQDIAGVREMLLDRLDFQTLYSSELAKAKQWNDVD